MFPVRTRYEKGKSSELLVFYCHVIKNRNKNSQDLGLCTFWYAFDTVMWTPSVIEFCWEKEKLTDSLKYFASCKDCFRTPAEQLFWAGILMSHSLGSCPRECFWFGVEAVNGNGEAARGSALKRVEFHFLTNRDIE